MYEGRLKVILLLQVSSHDFEPTLASGIDVGQGINVGPTSIPEAGVTLLYFV